MSSSSTEIVLATINAKYAHAAFGLRCLRANLGELRARSCLVEFTPKLATADMVEQILALKPRIVGLGVYIWNAEASLDLVLTLKRVAPELTVVLGGPEVSHECESQAIVGAADYTICGEGEQAFADLCRRIYAGQRPLTSVIRPALPELSELVARYSEYDDTDIARRVVYVEASRGCPFRCEFCLSSLDKKVRPFALEAFLGEMQQLLDRGLRQFKFVDRTFNLDIATSSAILEFFQARLDLGLFLHFEMIPDRLPDALRQIIARFPAGSLQFEVGVQTLDDAVARSISRRTKLDALERNLNFLRHDTGVHVHADLIIGLPGETRQSFADGLDRLVAMGPDEVQVGILKRLRGTPIIRHEQEFGLVFSPSPPYEILKTSTISFQEMRELSRFAHVWDRVVNRGHFASSVAMLFEEASAFERIFGLSVHLFAEHGRVHAIALEKLAFGIDGYAREELGIPAAKVRAAVVEDMDRAGHKMPRRWLHEFATSKSAASSSSSEQPNGEAAARQLPRRQRLHLEASRAK